MILYVVAAAVLFGVIFLFSSPKFSPIPYFPSNKKDMNLIIEALDLKNDQTVIDLGAGDGIVIFAAAEKALEKGLNTRFVAVEINPVLVGILNLRRLFNPNRKNITIVLDDIFKMDYGNLLGRNRPPLFYIYISPWYIEKTLSNIRRQLKHFKVVSYMYEAKSMKKTGRAKGIHDVFVYNESI